MKWVTSNKLSEITGYTRKAIYNKIDRGVWLRGEHWQKAPDGRLFFNLIKIENWIRG